MVAAVTLVWKASAHTAVTGHAATAGMLVLGPVGLIFVLVVVFLPGGIVEGVRRIGGLFRRRTPPTSPGAVRVQPAE